MFFIINKKKESTDKDGYYPEEVANNLKTYLYILSGIYGFLGISAFILGFPYKEENKTETDDSNLIEEIKEEIKEKKNISVKELFALFKTKKYLMILSFCICSLCKKYILFNF